jgi:hypothetical protein
VPGSGSDTAVRVATLRNLTDRLPFFTSGMKPMAQKVTIYTDTDVEATPVRLQVSPPLPQKEYVFTDIGVTMEHGMKEFECGDGMRLPMVGREWKIVIEDPTSSVVLRRLLILVRFNLG